MAVSLISNPPFNQKWEPPLLAGEMPAYMGIPSAPDNNANFAFVLKGLSLVDDRAAFILPNGVLSTSNKAERAIRNHLIEHNLLSAVVALPGNMFASTDIPTCILLFDKHKDTTDIWFFDLREQCVEEVRDQRGQFGGKSHTARTYHKTFNVIPHDVIDAVAAVLNGKERECKYGRRCPVADVWANDGLLTPGRYVDVHDNEYTHRPYEDMAKDLARVVDMRNAVKVTINETAARSMGWSELVELAKNSKQTQGKVADIVKQLTGVELAKEDYLSTSRSAILQLSATNTKAVPYVMKIALNAWKAQVEQLNELENVVLIELRDALLNDLMSGKLAVDENGNLIRSVAK